MQLPLEWKQWCAGLVGSAMTCYQNVTKYEKTIESINNLENLVHTSDSHSNQISIVDGILEKCANVADGLKNKVRDLLCQDRTACEQNFDQIWEKAKKEVQATLAKEKMEAADNCVKNQAIVSAVIIVIECHAIYKVWEDIENADNVLKTFKERDFPLIQERLNGIRNDQAALRKLIEENIREDNSELRANMRALSYRLILDVNSTRNMISKYIMDEIMGEGRTN